MQVTKRLSSRLLAGLLFAGLALGVVGAAAAAEVYKIDREGKHAFLIFKINHLGFSTLFGEFTEFDGVFTFDPENPSASEVEVSIDAASIDTEHEKRDEHLRSDDFFAVATYPRATFASTGAELDADGSGTITGDLTIRGITKSVTLEVTGTGAGEDPWGKYRRGFKARTSIALKDFGIDYDLGPKATHAEVVISLEGIRQGS